MIFEAYPAYKKWIFLVAQLNKLPKSPAHWLLNFAYTRGITPAEIEQSLNLEKDLNGGYATLSMEDYIRLINWTAMRLDEPLLGLQLSKVTKVSDFGAGMLTVYHAATLRDACLYFSRYDQTISKTIVIDFVEGKNASRLEYRINIASTFNISQETELAMALLMQISRKQLGGDWAPLEVGFSHKPNSIIEDYYNFFGKNLKFEQSVSYCLVKNSDLNVKITQADSNMLKVLREHADELRDKLLQLDDIVGQVKFFITQTLGTETCSADNAAEQFSMSRRNLTRQLTTRDTSFRELRNAVMEEVAKQALAKTSSSISTIALQLGYSESSAFDRAFKNLSGYTPMAYRNLN